MDGWGQSWTAHNTKFVWKVARRAAGRGKNEKEETSPRSLDRSFASSALPMSVLTGAS